MHTLELVARKNRDDGALDASPEDVSGPFPALPDSDDDRALPTAAGHGAVPATGDEPEQPALGPAGPPESESEPAPADPSVELPRFVQPAHALEADASPPARDDTDGSARRGSKAKPVGNGDWAPEPLVSGDPLLTGPSPVVKRDDARPDEEPAAPTAQPSRPVAPPTGEPQGPPQVERREPPVPPPPPPRRDPEPPPRPRTAAPPAPAVSPTGPPTGAIGGIMVPGGPTDPSGRTARRAARGSSLTAQQPSRQVARPADASGPTATLRPTTVAPVPRMAGRRPRVRRVTRVVRHVDPWSVFKVAAVFSLVAYVIAISAGVLLWNVAYSTGTIDNIERGMESTGWTVFELKGGEIFHNAWVGGLFLAVGMTGLAVLVATLFNLITDLVGGIRFTVLEEEVIEKTASPMRRFTTRRDDAAAPRR